MGDPPAVPPVDVQAHAERVAFLQKKFKDTDPLDVLAQYHDQSWDFQDALDAVAALVASARHVTPGPDTGAHPDSPFVPIEQGWRDLGTDPTDTEAHANTIREALAMVVQEHDRAVADSTAKWHRPRDGENIYLTHGQRDIVAAALAALTELEQREFNANAQRAIANKRAEAAEADRDRLQEAKDNWHRSYVLCRQERDRLADTLRAIAWGRGTHAQLVIQARAALDRHTKEQT